MDTVVVALSVCGDHMPEWRSAQGKTVHSCCAHVNINGVLVQDCRYAGRREGKEEGGWEGGKGGG